MYRLKQLMPFFLLLILFYSCRLGPKYKAPVLEVSSYWKEGLASCIEPKFKGLWWEIFGDFLLNQLEEQAIIGNPQLYIALDRVAQARALVGVDRAALYPQLNLLPLYSNTGMLFKIFLPEDGAFLPSNFPLIFRIHQLQYTMPLSMSYELDLWGKLRGQFNAAVCQAQAEEENLQTALLTLTTDLASAYFKLRSFDGLIEVQKNNLRIAEKNYELVQSRLSKGISSELDLVTARQEVSDNEASYYDLSRQRALQEHAIAMLIGLSPSEFCLDSMPLVDQPPLVQASLPSEVLLQRPDLRALERSMASQHALIGVAYASFFPSVELTGTLGFSSPDLREFLRWKSRLWSIGVNAMQPIFDAGYNEANLKLAYAQYYEALHIYQQRVLIAFQEVEDSLVSLQMHLKQYQSYAESSEAANRRSELAMNRYKNGLSNFLEVLDSERSKNQAEINFVNVLGLRYLSLIQLVKALGGSWSFSLETFSKEPCRSCEREYCNEGCGPHVIEDNVCGDVF